MSRPVFRVLPLATLAAAGCTGGSTSDTATNAPLVVMTYNVMCSFCTNQDHPEWVQDWSTRVGWLQDVISRHDPDLMGVQELTANDTTNPGQVDAIGDPSIYGAVYYHHQPADALQIDDADATVYYRLSRFDLEDHGAFWLGPNPDVAYSGGFTGSIPRLVVWTLLLDKVSAKEIWFATTHFDNNSPNQEDSAPLVLQRLGPDAAQHPLIFVGDFNSRPDSMAYGILTTSDGFHFDDTYDLSTTAPHVDTNVDPPPTFDPSQRIDHVFVAGGTFDVSDWVVDMWRYGEPQQAPSDHDGGVFATMTEP